MWKILKYSFYDLMRSRWVFFYFGFFVLLTLAFLYLSSDMVQVVLSLMNIVLVLVPLVATLFGVTYYYNSREFTELLLAQPIRRTHIFIGQFIGLAGSLSLCLVLGTAVPASLFGLFGSAELMSYLTVILVGVLLTCIFCALATWVAMRHDNRIRGFGVAMLLWLLFAVIYDGIFLLLLSSFSDYPLEKVAIGLSMLNPIDLGRVLITLEMDIAALMGYTGAVIRKTIGSGFGRLVSWLVLFIWALIPILMMRRLASRKDF